jgi:hypothetical protein
VEGIGATEAVKLGVNESGCRNGIVQSDSFHREFANQHRSVDNYCVTTHPRSDWTEIEQKRETILVKCIVIYFFTFVNHPFTLFCFEATWRNSREIFTGRYSQIETQCGWD